METAQPQQPQPIYAPKKKVSLNTDIQMPFEFGVKKDQESFLENLSMLLNAGINLIMALDIIKNGMKTRKMKSIVQTIKTEIEAGEAMWKTLDRAKLFSTRVIALIKIGEDSGRLPENLKMIVSQNEKSRKLKAKIKSAMMYPTIVMSVAVIVGLGVAWFILPKLSDVMTSLSVDPPFATKVIISIGDFLGEHGAIFVPAVLVVLILTIYFIFIFKKTNFIGEYLLLRLPVIRDLIKNMGVARFGFILGSLLDAGINFVNSIQSLRDSTDVRAYKAFYEVVLIRIQKGDSLHNILTTYDSNNFLFPFFVHQMMVVSEHTGSLSSTLMKIHKIHEEKVNYLTKNLTTLIEPLMMIMIFIVVLGLGVGIISPIYGLIGGLSNAA